MAGFIVLEDGRAYAAANRAYDAVIERIAAALPSSDAGREFSDWLMEQRNLVKGAGLGGVDLRELTPESRSLFTQAAYKAFDSAKQQEPERQGDDPASYPGGLDRFEDLLKMMESIRRGEPASAYNPHMRDVIPPTGERVGPGWDDL